MRIVWAKISATVGAASQSGDDWVCGTGKAKLCKLKRKGDSGDDLRKFVREDTNVEVAVVNAWEASFTIDTLVMLSHEECGAYVIINNQCN